MILPIKDVIAVQKARSYRLGYSGLVVVVRGHEELFFELGSQDKRDDLIDWADIQLEEVREAKEKEEGHSEEHKQALALKELESSVVPVCPTNCTASCKHDELSPIMFSSTSSSFVTFKPLQAMHSEFP